MGEKGGQRRRWLASTWHEHSCLSVGGGIFFASACQRGFSCLILDVQGQKGKKRKRLRRRRWKGHYWNLVSLYYLCSARSAAEVLRMFDEGQ